MITLRELREQDAPFMLEWMHDPDIQKCFRKNMMGANLNDTLSFCRNSAIPVILKNGDSLHFAITDENNEYLGTVSLKNIDLDNKSAEYAIVLRKKAQGHGIAYAATILLLKKSFSEYGLHRVYLNVLATNTPAINLYEKVGFKFEGEFREHLRINGKFVNWKWYSMLDYEADFKF